MRVDRKWVEAVDGRINRGFMWGGRQSFWFFVEFYDVRFHENLFAVI
jgi:hypothetical protein